MAKINLAQDIVKNYRDEEIISELYRIISGVYAKYNKIYSDGANSDKLWTTTGDIAMAAAILKALNDRNNKRLERTEAPGV